MFVINKQQGTSTTTSNECTNPSSVNLRSQIVATSSDRSMCIFVNLLYFPHDRRIGTKKRNISIELLSYITNYNLNDALLIKIKFFIQYRPMMYNFNPIPSIQSSLSIIRQFELHFVVVINV